MKKGRPMAAFLFLTLYFQNTKLRLKHSQISLRGLAWKAFVLLGHYFGFWLGA
jgi:hypothetical protein